MCNCWHTFDRDDLWMPFIAYHTASKTFYTWLKSHRVWFACGHCLDQYYWYLQKAQTFILMLPFSTLGYKSFQLNDVLIRVLAISYFFTLFVKHIGCHEFNIWRYANFQKYDKIIQFHWECVVLNTRPKLYFTRRLTRWIYSTFERRKKNGARKSWENVIHGLP